MGRPSCCKPRSQAPGIAAVALIIVAGTAVDKIRPEVTRIVQVAVEVLRILVLTTMTVVAVAIAAWTSTWLLRWWLLHRETQPVHLHQVDATETGPLRPAHGRQPCLACGGNGEVLRANSTGSFEPRACPECQPARLAG